MELILCFVDSASQHIHFRKTQLDAQFNFSIFRQTPRHVSDVSTAHHQEVHSMDTTIGIYSYFQMTVCCSGWGGTEFQPNQ